MQQKNEYETGGNNQRLVSLEKSCLKGTYGITNWDDKIYKCVYIRCGMDVMRVLLVDSLSVLSVQYS